MGIGDELMAAGRARRLAAGRPAGWKVAIRDPRKDNLHRWHPIWEGNSRIARPLEPYDAEIEDAPGTRPYVALKTILKWDWLPYGPEPAELVLTHEEMRFGEAARGMVLINPWIKAKASPNKLWPRESWQRLVNLAPHVRWLQIGEGTEPRLNGVPFMRTPGFREACGALSHARAAVLHEGGLHHAAAALGIPAVVIFGGYISPAVTGYASQRNLFVETAEYPLGCGYRTPCLHCHTAMHAIRPEAVLRELENLL
jgi:hypothetical protein